MRKPKINILFITADDMGWSSVGSYGCKVPDITPNIDSIARDGVRFTKAHVTVAVCQPSRGALMSGRYPQNSGMEGFHHIDDDTPLLTECLRAGGYSCGILGKSMHSSPKLSFKWDMIHNRRDLGMGRNPDAYYKYAYEFMSQAKEDDKPFFLMLNSHDPHRPFSGNDPAKWYTKEFIEPQAVPPSRTYTADEVEVPAYMHDLPEIRRELAEYYGSVKRCDDTVGMALRALKDAGAADNTIVIYLSDNGASFPFAKANCYLQSTKTPWVMSWPENITPGLVDDTHFISGIDLMPTLLDAVSLPHPEGMDGRSFLPLLKGEAQENRTEVYTQFHETSARRRFPMRCVQDARYGYIFNPWSDKKTKYRAENMFGRTFKAMREAAKDDPAMQERVNFNIYRGVEEFYDFEEDPGCKNNVIGDPRYGDEINRLRNLLEAEMEKTGDPALVALREYNSSEALESFMDSQNERAKEFLRKQKEFMKKYE